MYTPRSADNGGHESGDRREMRSRSVLVWDLPTRAFHWLMVALVIGAYVSWREDWMDWHVWIGYGALILVLFRLLWGFLGSDSARFTRFLVGPRAALGHLAHLLRREPDARAGHSPAGGWMVALLLVLLLGETLTGLYSNNDIANEGPLSELVPSHLSNAINDLHGILWDVLLGAVVLHVLAIGVYALIKGQDLMTPMVTGRKVLPAFTKAPRIAPLLRALLAFGLSTLVTALLINFL